MEGKDGLLYRLRPLSREDFEQVTEIEREAFAPLWSPGALKRELLNRMVRCLVAVQEDRKEPLLPAHFAAVRRPRTFFGWLKRTARTILFPGEMVEPPASDYLVGFVGIWFIVDDAHITELAVRSSHRGQGLGELLLLGSLEMCMRRRVRVVTLETRVSNTIAQALYTKYGFLVTGVRKRYYSDNNEDALIMSTNPITTPSYQELFQQMLSQFRERRGEPLWTLA